MHGESENARFGASKRVGASAPLFTATVRAKASALDRNPRQEVRCFPFPPCGRRVGPTLREGFYIVTAGANLIYSSRSPRSFFVDTFTK